MKHILLFTYVFTIPLLVSSIIILLLKNKVYGKKEDKFFFMWPFLLVLLAATVQDMFTFYTEDFMKIYVGDPMWLLNDLLFAGIAFCWIWTKLNSSDNRLGRFVKVLSKYYAIIYATAIIILYTSNATSFTIIQYIDFGIFILLGLNLMAKLQYTARKNVKRNIYDIYSHSSSMLIVASFLVYDLNLAVTFKMDYINIFMWFFVAVFSLVIILHRIRTETVVSVYSADSVTGVADSDDTEDTEDTAILSQKTSSEILENSLNHVRSIYKLTEREFDILREIIDGKNNAQIATIFCISENTVKTHVHNLLKKMDVNSKRDLIQLIESNIYKSR